MALPGKPLVWSPRGASDTLDSSTAFSGAMASLQNLIPDPTTKDLWQCRPAAVALINFGTGGPFSSGFSSGFAQHQFLGPGFFSCLKVLGTRVYGMVASALNPGRDQPFCYDIATNTFITITGITSTNTPVSPPTTGTWNPPNMALVGSKIIVQHQGFDGTAGCFFGVIDVTDPFTLTWTATNTGPTVLAYPPQWVVNFNGRCFFLVNPPNQQPAAYMSDSLNPTVITNANQILTFDDNVPLTCAVGLPLANQLGGVIQSLMVFKGVTNIYQVTGDYALMNLSINTLNVATGTFAPNTVCSTSKGLNFIAPDGLRLIDFNAKVSDPIGNNGDGIAVPFISALVPSRMCAAYNTGVYRVQVQNGGAAGNPQQQWWYDTVRGVWSGPHTQAASLFAPYSNTFIATLQGVNATLFQSDTVQSSSSVFTENGVALAWQWSTPMLPDTDQMAEVAIVQATLHMALVVGKVVTVRSQDQNAVVLDTVTVQSLASATNPLYPRQLDWTVPVVFRRMQINASGASAAGVKIGRLHMRYQVLGYLQQAS